MNGVEFNGINLSGSNLNGIDLNGVDARAEKTSLNPLVSLADEPLTKYFYSVHKLSPAHESWRFLLVCIISIIRFLLMAVSLSIFLCGV